MTNILISGVGFIGGHLANHLSQNSDNNIYGIVRSIKHESAFNALNLDRKENINVIFGNVNNYPDIEEIIVNYDIDQIYHLASQPIVKIAAKAPISTYTTNIFGTINILKAVRLAKVQHDKEIHTLVMSSDKAYGSSPILPYTEDLPLNANDIYSSSKACEDIISRTFANNYNLPITVARPCNNYAEYDFHWSRLVPTLAKTYLSDNSESEQLILNKGSYHHIRQYMYAQDTVRALESLIENIDKTRGEAYNVAPNDRYTTEEFVHKFINIAKEYYNIPEVEIQFKEKSSTFKEIPEQYLDCTKIKNATGWIPEFSIKQGLTRTIDGYYNWFHKKNDIEDIQQFAGVGTS